VGAVLHLASTQASAGNQASRNSRLAFTHPTRSAAHAIAQAAFKSVVKPAASGLLVAGLLALAGCGNNYRPVISAISPVGPATLSTKYAVAISNPGPGLPGLATFVDFSGDSVVITANIGVNPQYLILGSSGSEGYSINGDGTLSSFAITPTLLTSQVAQTTLPQSPYMQTACPLTPTTTGTTTTTSTAPTNCLATSIFPQGTYTYVTQPGQTPAVGEFSGTPPALQQNISNIGANPVFIAGAPLAPRIYSISTSAPISAGCTTGFGSVAAISTLTNSVDSTHCVGINPVYGVMTAAFQRTFIMNHGDGTAANPGSVTVINSQQDTLDSGVTNGTITDTLAAGTAAVGPIWADMAPTLNELLVVNQGVSGSTGSVSVFNIPLCSTSALPTNPNCNMTNPVDATGFGMTLANIPVGHNPIMIAALQDGSQAFVINQGDSTVSVINLTTLTVTATIPLPNTPNPTFVAATTGTPLGKVYVTSTTSPTMTIIRTDTDTIDTTVDLQGTGVQVRVTAP
jgi:YVTN family beta-propeller protein